MVTCTFEINVKKANRTPEEAGIRLLHIPKKPQWSPIYTISFKDRPASWADYIKEEFSEDINELIND
jgi:hypothetical protein